MFWGFRCSGHCCNVSTASLCGCPYGGSASHKLAAFSGSWFTDRMVTSPTVTYAQMWLLKRITPLHNIHKSLSRNQRARLESCHIWKWRESGPLMHPGPYSVFESGPVQFEGYWKFVLPNEKEFHNRRECMLQSRDRGGGGRGGGRHGRQALLRARITPRHFTASDSPVYASRFASLQRMKGLVFHSSEEHGSSTRTKQRKKSLHASNREWCCILLPVAMYVYVYTCMRRYICICIYIRIYIHIYIYIYIYK